MVYYQKTTTNINMHLNTATLLLALSIASFTLLTGCDKTASPNQNSYIDDQLHKSLKKYPQLDLKAPEEIEKLSPAIVELGKKLFFTKSLSGNNDVACASCHHPLLAGGDQLSLPIGVDALEPDLIGPGRTLDWQNSEDGKTSPLPNVPRNSLSTFNSALYKQALFWDGRVFLNTHHAYTNKANHRSPDSRLGQNDIASGDTLLETQTRFPITSTSEMLGFEFAKSRENNVIREQLINRLRKITDKNGEKIWEQEFSQVFTKNKNLNSHISLQQFQKAIAAYQTSQTFIDTPWSKYINGNSDTLTLSQKRGALLFFNDYENNGANCANCHKPPFFTDEMYHNIATPQFGRGKNANQEDFGRYLVTRNENDKYSFRTPTLINVAKTHPYMHNGAFQTLEQTIKHHANPVSSNQNFDYNFPDNQQLKHFSNLLSSQSDLNNDIIKHFKITPTLQNIELNKQEIKDLINFLKSLTDSCIQEPDCISRLIPNDNLDPSYKILNATFNKNQSFSNTTVQTVNNKPSPSMAITPKPEISAHYASDCKTQISKSVPDLPYFTETSVSSNITSKHSISPNIYNLGSLQRLTFSGGAAAGDINNDCLPDLYISTGDSSPDSLYINKGGLKFINSSYEFGITETELSNGAIFADIDGDSYLDLLTTNIYHPETGPISNPSNQTPIIETSTYKNNRGKSFTPWREYQITASNASWSLSMADIDGDTDLDLLSTHWQYPSPTSNHLWINEGRRFVASNNIYNLSDLTGTNDTSWTGIFSDINHDGFPDILMASDFEQSQIFINENGTSFRKTTSSHQLTDQNAMGATVIDYDNDGDLDWFVTSVHDPRGKNNPSNNWDISGNRLYKNENGIFIDATEESGVREGYWGWGACFADVNNDGWQDIFMTNGFFITPDIQNILLKQSSSYNTLFNDINYFAHKPNQLFISNKDGTFSNQAKELNIDTPSEGRAVICTDFDRDGDIDILISNNQSSPSLYKNNEGNSSNFINIKLKGLGKNTEAVGAKVFVTTDTHTQLQEIRAGGGFISGSPAELHFGLGNNMSVKKITIEWPQPFKYKSVLTDIKANQFITITQPENPSP